MMLRLILIISLCAFSIVVPISLMQPVKAHNGDIIEVPLGKNAVTIDGKQASSDEYADARWTNLSTNVDGFAIKHDETNLYVFVDFVSDTTFGLQKSQVYYDAAQVYFDTLNDGGRPKQDDYSFGILWKTDSNPFFGMTKGNGQEFSSPYGPPIAGSEGAATNGVNRQYEFKIPLSIFTSEKAGLYVIAGDGNANNGAGARLYWPAPIYNLDTFCDGYGDLVLSTTPMSESTTQKTVVTSSASSQTTQVSETATRSNTTQSTAATMVTTSGTAGTSLEQFPWLAFVAGAAVFVGGLAALGVGKTAASRIFKRSVISVALISYALVMLFILSTADMPSPETRTLFVAIDLVYFTSSFGVARNRNSGLYLSIAASALFLFVGFLRLFEVLSSSRTIDQGALYFFVLPNMFLCSLSSYAAFRTRRDLGKGLTNTRQRKK